MKILVIEDKVDLSDSICHYFANEQFVTETAYNYNTALEKISLYEYACIVLDITLPDGSGLNLLKELKANNKADGVIIISAKNSLEDKILGLKEGADDYLTKPFHLSELGARVAAIIRRKSFSGKNLIVFDEVEVNFNEKKVTAAGQEVELTKKEFDLLLYFISNKNRVVSKSAIAEHLWGDDMDIADNYDFIYTHVKNLRKKLLHTGCPDYVRSVYGVGYKFTLPK